MERRTFLVAFLLVGLAACDHGPADPGAEEGPVSMDFVVSAVTDNCSGNPGADPTQAMNWLWVDVCGPDKETGEACARKYREQFAVVPGANTVPATDVPAGTHYEVELTGFNVDDCAGKPDWYGKRRQVAVTQDQDNPISLVMVRYGAFTCLTPPTSFTQRVFPAVVPLNDGKVLITGGFTRATVDPYDTSRITLESASKVAVIYDPYTGVITQTQNTMIEARAGHAAVYVPLPDEEKVLIFGGTTKMTMTLDGTFPFSIDSADSLNSYEVFDLKTQTFIPAGDDQEGHPKRMLLKRAFPTAVRLFDNSVLIAGGGEWPKDQDDYRRAEIWLPEEDMGKGGIQDLGAASPWMMAQHNGAAWTKLEDTTDGLSRILFLGGTTDEQNLLEVYTQSSRQKEGVSGTFLNLETGDLKGLYFGSLTPMTSLIPTAQKKFVAIGGVTYGGGNYTVSDKAYILTVEPGNIVKVSSITDAKCAGRFFHTTSPSFVPGKAVVLGGFADYQGVAGSETCKIEFIEGQPQFSQLAAGQEPFVARAGHRAQLLRDDTLLVVGGMVGKNTLSGDAAAMFEIYAHPWIPLQNCD